MSSAGLKGADVDLAREGSGCLSRITDGSGARAVPGQSGTCGSEARAATSSSSEPGQGSAG